MSWKVMLIGLLFFSCASHAQNSITITDEEKIQMADRISVYLDKVSKKVMECTEKQNGKSDGCTCETREACPFKKEFDEFIDVACLAFSIYPEWKTNNLYYNKGHNISTKNIFYLYGKYCK